MGGGVDFKFCFSPKGKVEQHEVYDSLLFLNLPHFYLQFLVEGNMVFGVEKNNNKENKKESHSKYNGKQPKFELPSVSAAQGKKLSKNQNPLPPCPSILVFLCLLW